MHYAMAFRQIAAANALEVLGADVLQENRRGETTTAVAGIGAALASHLKPKHKMKRLRKGRSSSDNPQWRSTVTDIDSRDRVQHQEGKDNDDDQISRPTSPPSRPSRPSSRPSRPAATSQPSRPSAQPSRPPPRNTQDDADDVYSDDAAEEEEGADSSSSSKALVAAAQEVAAEESQSQPAKPPSKPAGGVSRPVRGASRPARGASRPVRPSGASSQATSVLKSVAADLKD